MSGVLADHLFCSISADFISSLVFFLMFDLCLYFLEFYYVLLVPRLERPWERGLGGSSFYLGRILFLWWTVTG